MDGHRFDEIARLWVTGVSRRRALRALGVGAMAPLAFGARGRASAQGAATSGAATCAKDDDCADADGDPCTGAHCDNGTCVYSIATCAPGFSCCGNGECCPDADGGQCEVDADCAEDDGDPCTGAGCEAGTCVPYILTCAAGFVCCGGACVAGCGDGQTLDADCACVGTAPAPGGTVDDGAEAVEGDDAAAAGSSGEVASVTDAPGDGSTGAGNTTGAPAAGGADAPPIRLPNTGTGNPTGAWPAAWPAPFALLGGAAVLVAGRVRRAVE